MQQHQYSISRYRIATLSWVIWAIALLHLCGNIFIIGPVIHYKTFGSFIFFNLVIGLLSVPGMYLFFTYYRYSVNKVFTVTYNTIELLDKKSNNRIIINSNDIIRIETRENTGGSLSRLPWSGLENFCFVDKNNQKILVTSLMIGLGELWLDSLAKRINSDKLIRTKVYFPKLPSL